MLEIVVCDDEKKESELIWGMLREICAELKQESNILVYHSSEELLGDELFRGQKEPDIGLLDIVMPDGNGIDLGRKLKKKFPGIALIYTTSYEDYCKQVVNQVHPFSFLVKPIDRQELKEQITECLQQRSGKKRGMEMVFENVRDSRGEKIRSVRLNVEDILYCEYVKSKREIAIALREETYYFREVFEKLSEKMEGQGFATNCRGCMVNLRHIRKLKGYSIFLDNDLEVQLAQKRVAGFKKQMNAFIHGGL